MKPTVCECETACECDSDQNGAPASLGPRQPSSQLHSPLPMACGLCLQPVGTNGGVSTYFKCHAFCKQCKKAWAVVSKACPICKQRQTRKRRAPSEDAEDADPSLLGYADDGWVVARPDEKRPEVDWKDLCGAKIKPSDLSGLVGGAAAAAPAAAAAGSVAGGEVIDLMDDSDDEEEL